MFSLLMNLGCKLLFASSQLRDHLAEAHGFSSEDSQVPVSAKAYRRTPRPFPGKAQLLNANDTRLPDIPAGLHRVSDVLSQVVVANHQATLHWPPPQYQRSGSPETDVAFQPLPSRHSKVMSDNNTQLAPLLSKLRHRPHVTPDDVDTATVEAQERMFLRRVPEPDASDIVGSWLARPLPVRALKRGVEDGAPLKYCPQQRRAGWPAFNAQFTDAKSKGLIDGMGQLPSPSRGSTPIGE